MSKYIEAFFKNENDAESAKADLQALTVEKELVEPIPDETEMAHVVPVVSSSHTGGALNFTEVLKPEFDKDGALSDKRHLTHTLHFYVQEEEYDRALSIIEKHEGHMQKIHLKEK
ncbi:hypothetical protein LCL89_08340 [Halobacillus yeomjeoni]|uniref:hypothetical protein n=1 Tax=Halobacillus yeomjeoni TaxID=311194 RepID=UPI001CD57988|nr:hypothetical protein [Halobacillus yeomjeoni]MCA0984051.1 hypothetical protein [Halobacillus yeomjeoni]